MVRLQILHVPKVDVITLVQVGSAGAGFHTNSSQASVQPTADAPQTIRVEIAVRTAEACDDGEQVGRGRVGERLADITQDAVSPYKEVRWIGRKGRTQRFVRQRTGHRLLNGSRVTHGPYSGNISAARVLLQTTSVRRPSISGRAIDVGIGVTKRNQ